MKRTVLTLREGWKKHSCGVDRGLIFGFMFSPFFLHQLSWHKYLQRAKNVDDIH